MTDLMRTHADPPSATPHPRAGRLPVPRLPPLPLLGGCRSPWSSGASSRQWRPGRPGTPLKKTRPQKRQRILLIPASASGSRQPGSPGIQFEFEDIHQFLDNSPQSGGGSPTHSVPRPPCPETATRTLLAPPTPRVAMFQFGRFSRTKEGPLCTIGSEATDGRSCPAGLGSVMIHDTFFCGGGTMITHSTFFWGGGDHPRPSDGVPGQLGSFCGLFRFWGPGWGTAEGHLGGCDKGIVGIGNEGRHRPSGRVWYSFIIIVLDFHVVCVANGSSNVPTVYFGSEGTQLIVILRRGIPTSAAL